MKTEMGQKILVFAPHPDDETLGCGGTIAKRVKEGYDVLIVVMTDGRNALSEPFGIHSNPSPEELKKIRKEELIKAVGILGVPEKNIILLDFEDRKLKENKEAEEKVTKILNESLPEEVYFPYNNEFHVDHQVTHRIVSNSLKRLGYLTREYQYSIMRLSRIGPTVDRFLNLFIRRIIRVDISDVIHIKRRAIEQFRSQITIISDGQKTPILLEFETYLKDIETFHVGNGYF